MSVLNEHIDIYSPRLVIKGKTFYLLKLMLLTGKGSALLKFMKMFNLMDCNVING